MKNESNNILKHEILEYLFNNSKKNEELKKEAIIKYFSNSSNEVDLCIQSLMSDSEISYREGAHIYFITNNGSKALSENKYLNKNHENKSIRTKGRRSVLMILIHSGTFIIAGLSLLHNWSKSKEIDSLKEIIIKQGEKIRHIEHKQNENDTKKPPKNSAVLIPKL